MTELDRKLLTEFLGECWHVPRGASFQICCNPAKQTCRKCKMDVLEAGEHRTFDSWQDLGDLQEKLVEKGEWGMFLLCRYQIFSAELYLVRRCIRGQQVSEIDSPVELQFPTFLMHPVRFSQLVADYLAERPHDRT